MARPKKYPDELVARGDLSGATGGAAFAALDAAG